MDQHARFSAAFAEWLRRYQANPNDFRETLGAEPGEYGDDCATYFITLLEST